MDIWILLVCFLRVDYGIGILCFGQGRQFEITGKQCFRGNRLVKAGCIISGTFGSFVKSGEILCFACIVGSFLPIQLDQRVSDLFFSPVDGQVDRRRSCNRIKLPDIVTVLDQDRLIVIRPTCYSVG